ncbi:hypothetical protein F5Y05DRAFT_374690 [Hypoxylon sp. FL0543]|nr:hypothetical protein F5Y05DRAFT_374690 [Hypoxylon sp. FL0543]
MTSLSLVRPLRAPRLACHILTLRRSLNTEHASKYRPDFRPNHARNDGAVESIDHLPGSDIQPGEHIQKFCREHNILFPSALRVLKGTRLKKNPCQLSLTGSRRHCFDAKTLKYLDKHEHPFTKSILQMYINKKSQPLWYTFRSFDVASAFPCREAVRRLKHAFRDALADYGYDLEGRRIRTGGPSVTMDLFGTVLITCADPKAVCNIKFADLLEQVKVLMGNVEQALARDKRGKHINAMGKPQPPTKTSHSKPAPKPPMKRSPAPSQIRRVAAQMVSV